MQRHIAQQQEQQKQLEAVANLESNREVTLEECRRSFEEAEFEALAAAAETAEKEEWAQTTKTSNQAKTMEFHDRANTQV